MSKGKTKGKAKRTDTPTDEQRDSLLDSLEGGDAPAFKFLEMGEGSTLVGRVLEFFRGASEWGPYPGVIVKSEDGGETYSVHCFPTVLRNQMIEQDPHPGDRIAIRYLGKQKPKGGGKAYHNFRVRVEGATKSFASMADRIPEPEGDDTEDDEMPF